MKNTTIEYEIIRDKTPYALIIGAFIGAIILQVSWFILLVGGYIYMAFFDHARMGDTFGTILIGSLFSSLLVGIVSFFVFLIGLIVIGAPAWYLMHRYGFRRVRHAIFLGSGLTFLTVLYIEGLHAFLLFFAGKQVPVNLLIGPIIYSAVISLVGGIVGFVIWRYSYYPVQQLENPESKAAI